MTDLFVGLGLFLALEGALYAGFPGVARRMAFDVSQTPERTLQIGGLFALLLGVGIVWFVRG